MKLFMLIEWSFSPRSTGSLLTFSPDRLDHQSKEQKALRKRYESELTHLNKTVQKKQTEVDELTRDKRYAQ